MVNYRILSASILLSSGFVCAAPLRPIEQELLSACKDGNQETLWRAFQQKQPININVSDDEGHTPIYLASNSGHSSIVKVLLNAQAKVNVKTESGETPLMAAVSHGFAEIAQLLIDANAELNAKDKLGRTALMKAAERGDCAMIKLLLATKKEEKSNTDKQNFWQKAEKKFEKFYNKILDKKLDLDKKDVQGDTALMIAAFNGHEEAVKMLIEANAKVDTLSDHGKSMLKKITARHAKIAQMLVKAQENQQKADKKK